MIEKILILVLCSLWAFAEIYLDKKIAYLKDEFLSFSKVMLDDYKESIIEYKNKLMHAYQWPIRAFAGGAIFLIGLLAGLTFVSSALLTLGGVWASVNIIANAWWLKKPWYYVGTTAKTDQIFGKYWIYLSGAMILFGFLL